MAELDATTIREIVDKHCDEYEALAADGNAPSIASILDRVTPAAKQELFRELISVEMEIAGRAGELPKTDRYLAEFPEYEAIIAQQTKAFRDWVKSTSAIDPALRSQIIGEEDTERQVLETKKWPEKNNRDSDSSGNSNPDTELDSYAVDDAERQQADETETPQRPPSADSPNTADQGDRNTAEGSATPGRRIGRYQVVRKIGQGGMGSVLLARDLTLDRLVALKLPRFHPDDAPEMIPRFYREARAMAAVQHANLCPIFEVGEDEGRPYIAMSFIDGVTLAELQQDSPAMRHSQAVKLVRTLALAVHEIHLAGVIHRDLKPSNIMIDQNGQPQITDFGLASRESDDELTQSGAVIGSPAYMAPEQVRGNHDEICPATDVYALGIILYQLLCGKRPFEGSVGVVLGKIESKAKPDPPSQLVSIDKDLEAICLKAMAHNADERFQSAAEFATALELLESTATDSPATHPPSRSSLFQFGLLASTIAGLIALLWWANVIFRVETKNGHLVVKVKDEKFSTSIQGKTLTFIDNKTKERHVVTLSADESIKNLPPGEYRFTLESTGGLRTQTDRFSISENNETLVEVWWEPTVVQASKDVGQNTGGNAIEHNAPTISNDNPVHREPPQPPQKIPLPESDEKPATLTVNQAADVIDGDTSSVAMLNAQPGADGSISLREAIIAANNTPGDDVIAINIQGVVKLELAGPNEDDSTTGDLDIRSNITIYGKGTRDTIIDGNQADRVFDILESGMQVKIRDLTIRNGSLTSGAGGGCRVQGAEHSIYFERVRMSQNQSENQAGGLQVASNSSTTVVIRDSLFDHNSGGCGGLVVFPGGKVFVINSTFTANTGVAAGAIVAQFNGGGSLDIVNCTIAENKSTHPTAGGIQKNDTTGSITLTNSIVTGNTGRQFWSDQGPVISSGGNNIFGPGNASFKAATNDRYYDGALSELLQPFANNGGPTDSYALSKLSPAIDTGNNAIVQGAKLTTDQRGGRYKRVQNGTVDIGAVEMQNGP